MKMRAPASCGPTREIALLIAEPRPERRTGTDVISAAVRGATMIMITRPKITAPGRKSVKYARGRAKVLGLAGSSFHAVLDDGPRAHHSHRSAAVAGPAAMTLPRPYFAATRP